MKIGKGCRMKAHPVGCPGTAPKPTGQPGPLRSRNALTKLPVITIRPPIRQVKTVRVFRSIQVLARNHAI